MTTVNPVAMLRLMSNPNTATQRYRVDQLGQAGREALVTDSRGNAIVLRLAGPDRFELAAKIAAALNDSPTETPIAAMPVSFA